MIGFEESRLPFSPCGKEVDAWTETLSRQPTESATEDGLMTFVGIQPRMSGDLGWEFTSKTEGRKILNY